MGIKFVVGVQTIHPLSSCRGVRLVRIHYKLRDRPSGGPGYGRVAVEVHNSQTVKRALGSDAMADGVGDADATHAAGTTVMEASKSLKQIFAEGPNFAAIEKFG